jgi:hypothetical protein
MVTFPKIVSIIVSFRNANWEQCDRFDLEARSQKPGFEWNALQKPGFWYV